MRLLGNRKESKPDQHRWCFWRWLDISEYGVDYVTRLTIFRCPWFGILLHWIHAPDPIEDLHDHPWPFIGFVLDGSYTEVVATPKDDRLVDGSFNHVNYFIKKTDPTQAHAIVAVNRAVTLLLVGRRCKDWSFFTPLGYASPGEADCVFVQENWKDRI